MSLDTPVPLKKQGLKNLATSPFPLGGEVRLFARKSMLESSLETVFMRRGLAWFVHHIGHPVEQALRVLGVGKLHNPLPHGW